MRLHHPVEVEFLAFDQPPHAPELLRLEQLELPPDPAQQVGVVLSRLVDEAGAGNRRNTDAICRWRFDRPLPEVTPAAPVASEFVVPFVVVVDLLAVAVQTGCIEFAFEPLRQFFQASGQLLGVEFDRFGVRITGLSLDRPGHVEVGERQPRRARKIPVLEAEHAELVHLQLVHQARSHRARLHVVPQFDLGREFAPLAAEFDPLRRRIAVMRRRGHLERLPGRVSDGLRSALLRGGSNRQAGVDHEAARTQGGKRRIERAHGAARVLDGGAAAEQKRGFVGEFGVAHRHAALMPSLRHQ